MLTTKVDQEELAAICQRNDIRFLGLFGSLLHGDATSESDIDLLARFSQRKSLIDLVRIEREIAEALGRDCGFGDRSVSQSALARSYPR
jgi:hypothetical protein